METIIKTKSETLSYFDAIILGLVEGITEYLPVSSTGHLIIANRLFYPTSDLEFHNAIDAYGIVIQIGAILAVFLLYHKRILEVIYGFFGNNKIGFRLGVNLLVAFMPAALLGLLFHDWIENLLFDPVPIGVALILGALLMLYASRWQKTSRPIALPAMNVKQALEIGLWQCLALFPGTSRSMVTLVGGYRCGLKPSEAAEFSFLLGFLTLSAASCYTLLSKKDQIFSHLELSPMLIGVAVATLSATFVIKTLIGFLNRFGLKPFAYYRIVLGIIIFIVFL